MIIEALVKMLVGLLRFVVGLFPDSDPPAWMDDASGYLDQIWTMGSGLGAWIPWPVFGDVLQAVLACLLISFGIKVVRIVLSLFTAGGGSAA